MTVDKERLEKKIRYIKENLDKLREIRKLDRKGFLNDYRNYDTAKYNLQVTIEALIDIGNHIISRKNYGVPKTNAETFRILGEKNILPEEKVKLYTSMARFRNMVVHLYEEIDEGEIYDIMQDHLEDFEYFIKVIYNDYLKD